MELEQLWRSLEGRATVHVERASTRNQAPRGATMMGERPLDFLASSTIGECLLRFWQCRLLGSLQPSNERGNALRRPISFRISWQGQGKSTENFSPRNKFRTLSKTMWRFFRVLKEKGVRFSIESFSVEYFRDPEMIVIVRLGVVRDWIGLGYSEAETTSDNSHSLTR